MGRKVKPQHGTPPIVDGFEKFVYPTVRSAWENLPISDFELVSSPIVSHATKLKAVWTVEQPQKYHPYRDDVEQFLKGQKKKTLQSITENWPEAVRNALYGYILTNPIDFQDMVEFSYAYLFHEALKIVDYVNKPNQYGVTQKDLLNQILSVKDKKADYMESSEPSEHVWIILNELSEQNLI